MAFTTVLFDDPVFDAIADGASATAANTGLAALTNNTGTAQFATVNGRRCITGNANNARVTVKVLADAVMNNASNTDLVVEILLEYVGTQPDSSTQNFCEANGGGGDRVIFYHRTDANWNQEIKVKEFDGTTLDAGTKASKAFADQIGIGKLNWTGTFVHKDSSAGVIGTSINGDAIFNYSALNTDGFADDYEGFGQFTPMQGTNLNYRIYGYRYSTTDDIADVVAPAYEYTDIGEARYGSQIAPHTGPYVLDSGPGTITFETDSGGVVSKLYRVRSGGTGTATLGLRSQWAPGLLRSSMGRACIGLTHVKAAASTVVDIRIHDSGLGDDGILTFRGDLGTAGARPIYLDGVQATNSKGSNVTYNEARGYMPTFVFDERTNQSAVILNDMSNNSTTEQHVFPINWDRTGGIPTVNDITITMYGPDCYVGMPFTVPLVDWSLPSSWCATPRTAGGASVSIPNHVGAALDAFGNPGYLPAGVMTFAPVGRSGQLAEYTKPWFGNFANMSRMKGMRLVYLDNSINDLNNGRTVAQILASFQEVVDMAVINDVRIAVLSNIDLQETTFDDTFRDNQRLVNAGILAIMVAANRPDLMYYAAVAETYTAEQMTALITTDDTHPTEAGSRELAAKFVELLVGVGTADVTQRLTPRVPIILNKRKRLKYGR